MTSLKKGIAFSPLWPLWPLWCLCVASVEIRHCVHSSMEFAFFSLRKVHSAFFPQRRHRGTIEATEACEEKTRCLFPERSQRCYFFFVHGQVSSCTCVFPGMIYRTALCMLISFRLNSVASIITSS